jgi:ankyrin repeat protein
VLLAVAAAVSLSSPAAAQFTKSYKFLDAVKNKDGQAVTDEIAKGSIINTQDQTTGQTALHIVVARRDTDWINFLLSKQADPNIADYKGVTPLQLATNLGFIEGMELLIEHGAHVDDADTTGSTPLIEAVHRHNLSMVRMLLKAGANPDKADSSGRSARDYAMLDGKDTPVGVEIAGAKVQARKASAGTYGPKL